MELIFRTAHGTADVSVDVHKRDVALRDVIAAVTGQAAPDAARVDGRMVNASDTLAACGVVAGSLIDTALDGDADTSPSAITALRQLTGAGAGRRVALSVGTYRIGPGHRNHVDELGADVADIVAFELDVATAAVTVSAAQQPSPVLSPLLLNGVPLTAPTPWQTGILVAAGRVFRLDPGPAVDAPRLANAVDGFIVHNRPPGVTASERTIADAIDDARARAPRLWHQRQTDGSVRVDIGLVAHQGSGALEPVAVDLKTDRVLAVSGKRRDRTAFARSVLVDTCTRYGPADLDVVIATTPNELGDWDWAKWLPHIRAGAAVDVLSNDLEMESFTARPIVRPTILVVTADELWNSAASPLRSAVVDAMPQVSVIVLTKNRTTAPASSTSLIDLLADPGGTATFTRLQRSGATLDMLVSLVDIQTATDVARHLTPLIDPDRLDPTVKANHTPLDDIVKTSTAATRWNKSFGAPGNPVEMGIGTVADATVGVDFEVDASIAISGSTIDEAVELATVATLSLASTWSPTEAALLIVDHRTGTQLEPLQHLPHHAGTFTARDAASIDRLLVRLRDELDGEHPNSARLVIAIMELAETELAAPGLIDALSEIAADSIGVHLIVATARPLAALPASIRNVCAVEVTVDRYGGIRRATISDRRRSVQKSFSPYDDPTVAADAVTVRPFVFGRQPTALERRLERDRPHHVDSPESAVARLVQQLSDLAAEQRSTRPRPFIPAPLPTRVVASELWANHAGDGVPLGIVDTFDVDAETADWWLPGINGSRLYVGSPRSGMRDALDVLLVGIADRFGADDVAVFVVEQNDRRREAIAAVPHVRRAASPDRDGAVEDMLSATIATLHERIAQPNFRLHDHPAILVLVRDVERLNDRALAALTELLSDGARVGVNVVASATRPDGIETAVAASDHIVVGALSDPEHAAAFGLERSATVDLGAGRAQMVDSSGAASSDPEPGARRRAVRLVQVAELDAPLETVLRTLVAMMEDEK